MINAKPRWTKNYIDVLDRATTDTVTKPGYAQMLKHNGLIARHQRSGIWTLTDVYYNFRHEVAEPFNYYNWKAPATFKITKVGTGTTQTSNTKVAFNGASGYYNTGYTPTAHASDNYSLNNAGIGAGIITTGGVFSFGANNSGARFTFLSGAITRINAGSTMDISPSTFTSTGKMVFRRTNSTTISFNYNGVADGSGTQNSDGDVPNFPIFLGCRNNNSAANGAAGVQLSYFWLGAAISDALALQVYNDETAFEASL
jgi:hypothetical protein